MFASNSSQVSSDAVFIEDVFSTYLYTGNGSSQTITNGIDLAGKGGLFWVKARAVAGSNGLMYGSGTELCSNSTNGLPASQPYTFGASGITFTGGIWSGFSSPNESGRIYTSWTFRKQPKFFDIVTYTGTGVARTIAHNLGSVPGCIIIKRLDDISNWPVYHRSNLANDAMFLNTTDAINPSKTYWNNTRPTSTVFSLGDDSIVNQNGGTFVAYLFAHDAGGFGTAGTDNVISCGSFVGTGANQTINLGWEPQFLLTKRYDGTGNWIITDNMRGQDASFNGNYLYPNLSNAETGVISSGFSLTSTGFITNASSNYIYIAIRRGPMKTPTSGTSVFNVVSRTGNGTSGAVVDAGFPVDLAFVKRNTSGYPGSWEDRLRGNNTFLSPNLTDQEYNGGNTVRFTTDQNGISLGTDSWVNASSQTYFNFFFRRAAGFFDVVCYTGNDVQGRAIEHNLQAIPELIICKQRNAAANWYVWATSLGATEYLRLQLSAAKTTDASVFGSAPNSTTTFPTGGTSGGALNALSQTYVAYLFATCPSVSKVGSYTGTGTTLQINCGFTGGARFVLIKRTDSTGDWYVWDTARGIVSGNDPYLLLNTNDGQNSSFDYIDPYSAGFEISSTAPAAINASGGTYIYLAIA